MVLVLAILRTAKTICDLFFAFLCDNQLHLCLWFFGCHAGLEVSLMTEISVLRIFGDIRSVVWPSYDTGESNSDEKPCHLISSFRDTACFLGAWHITWQYFVSLIKCHVAGRSRPNYHEYSAQCLLWSLGRSLPDPPQSGMLDSWYCSVTSRRRYVLRWFWGLSRSSRGVVHDQNLGPRDFWGHRVGSVTEIWLWSIEFRWENMALHIQVLGYSLISECMTHCVTIICPKVDYVTHSWPVHPDREVGGPAPDYSACTWSCSSLFL